MSFTSTYEQIKTQINNLPLNVEYMVSISCNLKLGIDLNNVINLPYSESVKKKKGNWYNSIDISFTDNKQMITIFRNGYIRFYVSSIKFFDEQFNFLMNNLNIKESIDECIFSVNMLRLFNKAQYGPDYIKNTIDEYNSDSMYKRSFDKVESNYDYTKNVIDGNKKQRIN